MRNWRDIDRDPLAGPFVDTLAVARRRFPGAPASLDALCRRFAIDLSARDKHGAEIDCSLLAAVYIELLGGRQPGLDFAVGNADRRCRRGALGLAPRPPRPHAPTAEELAAHQAMLAIDHGAAVAQRELNAPRINAIRPVGGPPAGRRRRCAATVRQNRSG